MFETGIKRPRMLYVLGCLAVVGCAHRHQVTWELTKPVEMQDVVAEHIPAGTSLADAQRFMEAEGFTCSVERGKNFSERRAWFDEGVKHENLDFVKCTRSQSEGHFLMARVWSVALVLEGDVVTNVLVGHYIDGP